MSFVACFTSSDMNQDPGSAGSAVELRMAEEDRSQHREAQRDRSVALQTYQIKA